MPFNLGFSRLSFKEKVPVVSWCQMTMLIGNREVQALVV